MNREKIHSARTLCRRIASGSDNLGTSSCMGANVLLFAGWRGSGTPHYLTIWLLAFLDAAGATFSFRLLVGSLERLLVLDTEIIDAPLAVVAAFLGYSQDKFRLLLGAAESSSE